MLIAHKGLIRRGIPPVISEALAGAGVIFVSAPAGFGKTVAARQWADSQRDAKAFMALDDYDNNMGGFCRRFCALLGRCQPQNTALAQLLAQKAPDADPRELALKAVGALSARKPCLLVLDDLHHVQSRAVTDLLAALLAALPPVFRVMLISRDDLPPGFSALRPMAIGPRQLRFTRDDILRLCQKRGRPITPQRAAEIARYTGGWPVGVCALLRMEGEGGDGGYLDAFIVHNIWNRWDAPTRAFMLSTALAGPLYPQLCAQLAGEARGARLLARLARAGAFVSRTPHGAYAYHPMFQDFLRRRLAQDSPGQERDLLETEGRWYLGRGDYHRAAACFIRSESPALMEQCFALLESARPGGFDLGPMLPMLNAPQVRAAAQARPSLFYFLAWAAWAGGRDRDMARYVDAYEARGPQDARSLYLHVLDFRRPPAPNGALPPAPGPGAPRGILTLGMPLLHRSVRDFSAMALGEAPPDMAPLLARLAAQPGEAETAAACLAAGLLYEQGHYEQALDRLRAAPLPVNPDPALTLCVEALGVCLLDALGQRAEADAALAAARALIAEDGGPDALHNLDALAARRSMALSEPGAAKSWLARHPDGAGGGTHMYGIYGAFTTARAYMAAGDWDSAIILLTRLQDLARRFCRPLDMAEAQLLLAVACWQKRPCFGAHALGHLENALNTAAPYGFTALFDGERAGLSGLLPRLAACERHQSAGVQAFAGLLCKRLGYGPHTPHPNGAHPTGPHPPFTHKQRQVMGLLCQGKSYREIAGELSIKLPTLRSHMALIYKKLDVSTEGDAVRRMKALGLIDPMDLDR